MTKKAAAELIDKLLFKQQQLLDKYRAEKGPTTWGENPSDSHAAYLVGRIQGLNDARKAITKRG